MNSIERLVALKWLERQMKRAITETQREVDAHYHDRMTHELGDDGEPKRSFKYRVGGKRLASFWYPMRKEVPERHTLKATCYDWSAVLDDDNPDFAEWLADHVKRHIGELAEQYVTETGDVLDGVAVTDEVTPAVPGHVEGLRCKPNWAVVDEIMTPQLAGETLAGLLEGGA